MTRCRFLQGEIVEILPTMSNLEKIFTFVMKLFIYILIYLLCIDICVLIAQYMYGCQKTICWSYFSPPTMWVPEVKFQHSGTVVVHGPAEPFFRIIWSACLQTGFVFSLLKESPMLYRQTSNSLCSIALNSWKCCLWLELQACTMMPGYMLAFYLRPYLDHWTGEQFILKEVTRLGNHNT